MMERDGLKITITLIDEESARAIEWILKKLLGSEPLMEETVSQTLLPRRTPSDAQLAGLERLREQEASLRRDRANLVSRNREGLMPFRTDRKKREE